MSHDPLVAEGAMQPPVRQQRGFWMGRVSVLMKLSDGWLQPFSRRNFRTGKSLAVISRLILSTVDTWTLGLTGGFPTWKLWLEAFTQSCHRRCNWELKHQRDWTLEPCLVIPSAKAPKSLLLHGCSRFKWFKCWGCKNINIESIKKHQRASNNIEIYRTA